jgi:hypothetical protein
MRSHLTDRTVFIQTMGRQQARQLHIVPTKQTFRNLVYRKVSSKWPSQTALPSYKLRSDIGLGTEFHSEKFRGIDSERFPLFRGRKCSFRGMHSEFRGRANSEARNGTERNGIPRKNEVLRKSKYWTK